MNSIVTYGTQILEKKFVNFILFNLELGKKWEVNSANDEEKRQEIHCPGLIVRLFLISIKGYSVSRWKSEAWRHPGRWVQNALSLYCVWYVYKAGPRAASPPPPPRARGGGVVPDFDTDSHESHDDDRDDLGRIALLYHLATVCIWMDYKHNIIIRYYSVPRHQWRTTATVGRGTGRDEDFDSEFESRLTSSNSLPENKPGTHGNIDARV